MAGACGLLGCFLVLRKMAMVGDAISHAVLPGIVLAFLIFGSRQSLPMVIGASAVGVLTTLMIEMLYRRARVQADASIGITFTWLFALGVVLISLLAGQVDLDQDCVLYGEIAYVPLDQVRLGESLSIPRATLTIGVVFLLVAGLVWFGYKGFLLTSFDPDYAAAIGISTTFWHYLLMALVSVTTVVSFEAVGAILVVAFLVAPPATAWLLTNKLREMLMLTLLLGILAAVGGYGLAVWLDGSIAGAMTVAAGFLFLLAFLFSPQEGIFRKVKRIDPRIG